MKIDITSHGSLKKGYLFLHKKNISEFKVLVKSILNNKKINVSVNGNFLGPMSFDEKYSRLCITTNGYRTLVNKKFSSARLEVVGDRLDILFK